jgi:hypothetical protein
VNTGGTGWNASFPQVLANCQILPNRGNRSSAPLLRQFDWHGRVLEPLSPLELSPETNPKYMDCYRETINCLNVRGLKAKPLPSGDG